MFSLVIFLMFYNESHRTHSFNDPNKQRPLYLIKVGFSFLKYYAQLTAITCHFPVLSISWPIEYFKGLSKTPVWFYHCRIQVVQFLNACISEHTYSVPEWFFLQAIIPKEDLFIPLEADACWSIRSAAVKQSFLPPFLSLSFLFVFFFFFFFQWIFCCAKVIFPFSPMIFLPDFTCLKSQEFLLNATSILHTVPDIYLQQKFLGDDLRESVQ